MARGLYAMTLHLIRLPSLPGGSVVNSGHGLRSFQVFLLLKLTGFSCNGKGGSEKMGGTFWLS